jgi:hypothetical protein
MEAGFLTELWVISAGYGLYPASAVVPRYAATFNSGHPDSVVPRGYMGLDPPTYLARWWYALSRHVSVPGVATRTFEAIAKADRSSRILVVGGQSYLQAITTDLLVAAGNLSDPENLVVISCGSSTEPNHLLRRHLVPIDARFQSQVGGTRSALNARVARWMLQGLLNTDQFSASRLAEIASRTAAGLGDARTYDRTPMTDEEVLCWIRRSQTRLTTPSATALLRMFRNEGNACEQKRFGRIFGLVRESDGGEK